MSLHIQCALYETMASSIFQDSTAIYQTIIGFYNNPQSRIKIDRAICASSSERGKNEQMRVLTSRSRGLRGNPVIFA